MTLTGALTSRDRNFTKFVVCIVWRCKNDWVNFFCCENAFGGLFLVFLMCGGSVRPVVQFFVGSGRKIVLKRNSFLILAGKGRVGNSF